MDLLNELLQTATDPRLRHVAIVHVPIGLATIAPVAAIGLVAFDRHRATLRWVLLVTYSVVAVAALLAAQAGEQTIPRFGTLTGDARTALVDHSSLGGWVWVLAGIAALASAGTFLRQGAAARTARWTVLGLSLACAGLVGLTGHLGGTFVHVHLPKAADNELQLLRAEMQSAKTLSDQRGRHFVERVEPVLAKSCVWCHTSADGDPAGGLDLTSREGLLKGGQGGPVVVQGKPEESVLYLSVARTHPVLKMPKRAAKLPEDQIEAISQWIRDGCVWPVKTSR
ncbi:MAG: c-type cytochrome domain-containing protein [Phycisphaerales bacterium]